MAQPSDLHVPAHPVRFVTAAALFDAHVRVYGGGGGVIVPEEIARLAKAGVKIFSPEDGQRLGLPGMINELIRDRHIDLAAEPAPAEAAPAGARGAPGGGLT